MFLGKKIVIWILTLESRLILAKYKPFIVAVTGSVGKTSTKDAIYAVLKDQSTYVRKSDKSMNSDIGLPLTVIGVPTAWRNMAGWISNIRVGLRLIMTRQEYPDCLILEIGADHPGDIKRIVKWLHPDIAVVTKVSKTPVHVEFFKSPEEVFEEKAALAMAVKPGGSLVLFADDDKVMTLAFRVAGKNVKDISFGTNESAKVKASSYAVTYDDLGAPTGFTFNLEMDGAIKTLTIKNVLGSIYQYPLLAAAAVGKVRGMSPDAIVESLATYDAPKGRMNIIPGINGSTLIDDTYNSSPDAASSALETLKDLQCKGIKIAALGDMMELGKYSADEHRAIGKLAAGIVSRLVTVGQRSRLTADDASRYGMKIGTVKVFNTSTDAASYLPAIVKSGDIILIKGSQSVRMERIVKALMNEPNRASELLVRQEKEWLEKE
jgi:UDP-N-acetylmuramoyl-tripeptide--D-alanyl-D-alanine ligase